MKRIFMLPVCLILALSLQAQAPKDTTAGTGYKFTVVKENPITSVKNQANSGTCWSYSGVGFLESELIKSGKGTLDLSEMYIVRRNYEDKAAKFVRLGGKLNFGQGGSFADVVGTLDEYGVLPNSDYEGLNYGEPKNSHGELEGVLSSYIKSLVDNKKLSTAWFSGFKGILDAYLGKVPQTVSVGGKSMTPQAYAQSLGLKSDNYVSISSFTHHPFYSQFAIEVPDNWRWANSYNLPLDEFMQVIDNAIENGYTVLWGSDVSEIGFTRDGLAVIPDQTAAENIGSDQAHWLGLSQTEKNNELKKKINAGPVKELSITQELRQKAYDNYETTDDHGMQIYGIAKDQNGTKYYMVKNSWGEAGKYKGLWYASESFVRYKTLNYVVNKNAIPKEIRKKLNIQ
ncbi:MAG: C1 family peptidase [Dysgonamonadaceae bacterium]